MKKILCLLIFAMSLIAVPVKAAQPEVINNLSSKINVNQDGSITVTEIINVYAGGIGIKHGIYRDLILDYAGPDANHFYEVSYRVLSVKRNGQTEAFHLERAGHNLRIYIGDEDNLVPIGVQNYELTYTAYGLMRYLSDFDELYWNVTGNFWEFPILHSQAKVILPWKRADFDVFYSYSYSYTGPVGSTAQNSNFESGDEVLNYETIQTLNPGEGFSIVVGFPKERVATMRPRLKEVDPMTKFLNTYSTRDRINLMAGLSVIVIIYFILVWVLFGRDPRKGTIIAQYEAPAGYSPCDIALISTLGRGISEALGAMMVSLAVKGKIKIIKKEGFFRFQNWQFDCIDKSTIGLSEEEIMMVGNLFKAGKSISLPSTDSDLAYFFRWKLWPYLNKKWHKTTYIKNTFWLTLGTIMTLGVSIIYLILNNKTNFIFFIFVSFPVIAVISVVYKMIKSMLTDGATIASVYTLIIMSLFVIGLSIIFWLPISQSLKTSAFEPIGWLKSNWYFIALLLAYIMNILAFKFIRRPTKEGREILDRIEGFKLFLATTEKDRMEFFHPINKTPETFEKYFPYAIALGVADKWVAKFENLFIETDGHAVYAPTWYIGSLNGIGGISGISSIGTSLGSSLSSSGAGGGGGSGGGGGGGGGGGW